MKFSVVKQNKKITQIEIDTKGFEQLLEILKKINKDKGQPKRARKNITLFSRKVVPFFMNQFKKHLEDSNTQESKEILSYLNDLKSKKTSKQKKFELGDLVNIFKDQSLYYIQESWKDFLIKNAKQSTDEHPKLTPISRQQYQSEIQPLIDQISQKQPYKLYLSREQKAANQGQECSSIYDYDFSSECFSSKTQNQPSEQTSYDDYEDYLEI